MPGTLESVRVYPGDSKIGLTFAIWANGGSEPVELGEIALDGDTEVVLFDSRYPTGFKLRDCVEPFLQLVDWVREHRNIGVVVTMDGAIRVKKAELTGEIIE